MHDSHEKKKREKKSCLSILETSFSGFSTSSHFQPGPRSHTHLQLRQRFGTGMPLQIFSGDDSQPGNRIAFAGKRKENNQTKKRERKKERKKRESYLLIVFLFLREFFSESCRLGASRISLSLSRTHTISITPLACIVNSMHFLFLFLSHPITLSAASKFSILHPLLLSFFLTFSFTL